MNATSPRVPDFLIGGAPKGGTTALANYLRDHELIFVPHLKEPFYFASDLPSMRSSMGMETEQDYLNLFADAKQHHRALGEGSTLYLFSDNAIPNALEMNPAMKFIFLIRRPTEIAYAYHMQMRFHENETFDEFVDGWNAQEARQQDPTTVSDNCAEPRLLQYADVAAVGTQLERANRWIPGGINGSQCLVILFDDFVKNTQHVYQNTLEFLGIPDDGREEFARENAAMKARIPAITRVMRSSHVRGATQMLKRRLSGRAFGYAKNLKHSLMFSRSPRKELDEEFDVRLHEHFQNEIELMEQLTGHDLSDWKHPKPSES